MVNKFDFMLRGAMVKVEIAASIVRVQFAGRQQLFSTCPPALRESIRKEAVKAGAVAVLNNALAPSKRK